MMSDNKKYSLIIIGAGITGLSTALAWSKVFPLADKPVLILEKNAIPGGCVSTFAREGYRFDTTQIIPDVFDVLEFFNIDIPLLKFDNYYARLFVADTKKSSAKIFIIPSTVKDFEQMMTEKYPDEKIKINAFFNYCFQMHHELRYLKTEPKWYELPKILFKCRKILANSGTTYQQFLDSFHFSNPEIIQVLDIFSSFSGLSGNRCASLLTACAMVTTLNGSYRPSRGFIQFPIALSEKVKSSGCDFRLNCNVKKIIIENNTACGVQLDNGEIFESEFVISTADTKLTFDSLVGKEYLRKSSYHYYKKLEKIKMSPSGISIQLGLDEAIDLKQLGFNCGYNVLTSSLDAYSKMFDAWEKGELLISDECFHIAVICPSLMIGGKQNLIIHIIPVPSEKWIKLKEENIDKYNEEKMRIADFYIQKVEQYMIPNLREHIIYSDISTPATFKDFIGSPTGSLYDMLPLPSNFGKNRLKTRTPVKNLFVPKFSHGIWPCMQAGLQVVDMISGGKIMKGNSSL